MLFKVMCAVLVLLPLMAKAQSINDLCTNSEGESYYLKDLLNKDVSYSDLNDSDLYPQDVVTIIKADCSKNEVLQIEVSRDSDSARRQYKIIDGELIYSSKLTLQAEVDYQRECVYSKVINTQYKEDYCNCISNGLTSIMNEEQVNNSVIRCIKKIYMER